MSEIIYLARSPVADATLLLTRRSQLDSRRPAVTPGGTPVTAVAQRSRGLEFRVGYGEIPLGDLEV